MDRFDYLNWRGPCGFWFKAVLSSNTYSLALYDRKRNRIAWTKRKWGPSIRDALSRAYRHDNPEYGVSALEYLFTRLDGYADSPGIIDIWMKSRAA